MSRERRPVPLLRTVSGALTLQTAGAGLNLLSQLALARALGVHAFGQYSYAFNLSQLLATPADLGSSSSVTRFIPEFRVRGEADLLRGLLLVVHLVPLVVGAVVAALTAAVVSMVGAGSAPVSLMLVAVAGIPLFTLSVVLMNVLRALGSIAMAFAPVLVLQPLLVLLAVVSLPGAGVLTLAWVTVGALAVVVGIQLVCVRVHARRLEQVRRRIAAREWLSVSLPLLLINVVQLAFQRLDIVAVGLLLGAREAGIYAIANRLAVAAASLQKAMLTVVAPRMSSLHWSGQHEEVEHLVLRGLRLVIGPAALVTVVLVVAGAPILGLIGEPYRAGYLALVVYALGQLASVASGPVGWLATIIGEHRAMARVTVVSALIAILGYATLIPTIGIVGAAAANSVGVVYRNLAAARLARRHGFRVSLRRALARHPAGADA
jgi:O-antigen/teichoic acid export membrane protein